VLGSGVLGGARLASSWSGSPQDAEGDGGGGGGHVQAGIHEVRLGVEGFNCTRGAVCTSWRVLRYLLCAVFGCWVFTNLACSVWLVHRQVHQVCIVTWMVGDCCTLLVDCSHVCMLLLGWWPRSNDGVHPRCTFHLDGLSETRDFTFALLPCCMLSASSQVLVTDATVASIAAAKAAGRSTWRVSSTVFSHIASDQLLQPLGRFAQQPGAAERYPATPAGLQVRWLCCAQRVGPVIGELMDRC
jgi:hypothetical protein